MKENKIFLVSNRIDKTSYLLLMKYDFMLKGLIDYNKSVEKLLEIFCLLRRPDVPGPPWTVITL